MPLLNKFFCCFYPNNDVIDSEESPASAATDLSEMDISERHWRTGDLRTPTNAGLCEKQASLASSSSEACEAEEIDPTAFKHPPRMMASDRLRGPN